MKHKALIKRLQTTCFGLDPIDPLRLLVDDVIEALRENAMREVQRLGQEIEQEPVAYLCENAVGHKYFRWKKPSSTYKPTALYTSPPAQRTWVGMTDEEIEQALARANYAVKANAVAWRHGVEWAQFNLMLKNT
jgi:hypothetical protein